MEKLLHYEIARKLGEGKNGPVYLAVDTGLQRAVAVKLLDHPGGCSKDWREAFLIYMQRLSGIDDERLARFHSLEEVDGRCFVVREYVEGRSLKDLVNNGPVEYTRFMEIALQLVSALKLLHDRSVSHGNVTTGNVILDNSGRVKLVDPGLALPEKTPGDDPVRPAPKQLTDSSLSLPADLCSVGAVLHHLLTGKLPLQSDEARSTPASVQNRSVSPDDRSLRQVPGVARLLITKLLAQEPGEGFGSIDELLFTVQGMMSLGQEPPVSAEQRGWSPTPRQYLMVSVLVVLLVILWLVVTSGNQ